MASETDEVMRREYSATIGAIVDDIKATEKRTLSQPKGTGDRLPTGGTKPTAGHVEKRIGCTAALPVGSVRIEKPEPRTQTDKAQLTGYAAVTNSWSQDLGFFEMLAPGAFRNVLKDDVVFLINHSPDLILGRTGVNLRLYEDDKGLKFYLDLRENNSLARDTFDNVQAGIWQKCSFAFTSGETDEWIYPRGELPQRIIHDITGLFDVSCVTTPAYLATSIETVGSLLQRNSVAVPDFTATPRRSISLERQKQIEIGYRKATRILNRCKSANEYAKSLLHRVSS